MKAVNITALSIAAFITCCILSHSCANTTTPPSGGPKDTIPPVLVNLNPENGTTEFPIYGGKILITYNEYTVIKNQNDVSLSPPMRKRLLTRVKGKSLLVTFSDTLQKDRTYTIDFGESIVDNNEGNVAPRLVYTFSTGKTIDSAYFTGRVYDSKTLAPVKKAFVAIFSDLSDSACFKTMPEAAVKTDEWGYFVLRNIRPIPYRIYAYTDADGNFLYNPDTDEIAFVDTVFTPNKFVNDTIFELGTFRMKDTLQCQARKCDFELPMFKELQSVQYIQNSGRNHEKSGFLKFSASNAVINSMEFWGLKKDQIITQFNHTRDSMDFWINSRYHLPDSLMLKINYMKSDSLGVLVATDESLSIPITKPKEETKPAMGKGGKGSVPDSTFKLSIDIKQESVETEGFAVLSEWPYLNFSPDSIKVIETNPKGQKKEKAVNISKDSTEIRRFIIKPVDKLVKGYDYNVSIPQGTFRNLLGRPNSKELVKLSIPQDEKLSTLSLDIKGCSKGGYIIELTSEDGKKVVREKYIRSNGTVDMFYLQEGKYKIRITHDINGNGYLDTGNLLERRVPEPVMYYGGKDNQILNIPQSSEIVQEIDLGKIFK